MEKIIVFGTGSYFLERKKRIEKFYDVLYCIDNAVKKDEYRKELGLFVFNPTKIIETKNERIFCLSKKGEEMRTQLLALGVEEKRIVWGEELLFCLTQDMELSEYSKGVCVHEMFGLNPVDRMFGSMHGTPVDRYYIDRFIFSNKETIKGTVLEIGSLRYVKEYGGEEEKAYALHVNGWGENTIKANLETGEGIQEEIADCIICTQTLQYIFDLKSAVNNIFKMLKVGGHGLVTLPGIKSISILDNDNWNDLWSFTGYSVKRLFGSLFRVCNIQTYGNVKVVMGYLYGIPAELFSEDELNYIDDQYHFLITVHLVK